MREITTLQQPPPLLSQARDNHFFPHVRIPRPPPVLHSPSACRRFQASIVDAPPRPSSTPAGGVVRGLAGNGRRTVQIELSAATLPTVAEAVGGAHEAFEDQIPSWRSSTRTPSSQSPPTIGPLRGGRTLSPAAVSRLRCLLPPGPLETTLPARGVLPSPLSRSIAAPVRPRRRHLAHPTSAQEYAASSGDRQCRGHSPLFRDPAHMRTSWKGFAWF